MTVIRPNSISGITSITAQANEINVFKSDGTLAGLSLNGVNVNTTTGISTYAALNVTGNISIGGTLTYQDVTNVDSLGIGTFRAGIDVSGGQLDLNDNIKIRVGSGNDLELYHNGSHSIIANTTGNLYLQDDGEVHIGKVTNAELGIKVIGDGAVELYYDNAKIFETGSDQAILTGKLTINRTSNDEKLILQGSSNPYMRFKEGTTNKAYLQWNSDGQIILRNEETSKDLRIGSSGVEVLDNVKFTAGNSQDLQLFHDGTHSYITETGTGSLLIQASRTDLLNAAGNEFMLTALQNGAVSLYYNGTKKFETLDDGAVFDGDGVSEIKISDDGDGFDATGGAAVVAKGYFDYSGSVTGFYTDNAGRGVIGTKTSQEFHFIINNSRVMHITQNGYLVPASNNAKDLGTSSLRWRNIYTNDLNLSNKGSTNSVDNTWGDYTIQEGESDLFLINNRNGKKYKFNLTEVS